jgi:hypothetical protein
METWSDFSEKIQLANKFEKGENEKIMLDTDYNESEE